MDEINIEIRSDNGVCKRVTKDGRLPVMAHQVEAMIKVLRRRAKPARLCGMEVWGDVDILVLPRDK